ncbi:hypothetical protein [Aliarcobacter butzleri]|uniref:hypothetical protein n=1 Tax=Aliarcobacter butzleri TaxID=28197 RepID=UPI003AFA2FC9
MYVNVPLIEKTLSFQLDAGLMDTDEKDNAVKGTTAGVVQILNLIEKMLVVNLY